MLSPFSKMRPENKIANVIYLKKAKNSSNSDDLTIINKYIRSWEDFSFTLNTTHKSKSMRTNTSWLPTYQSNMTPNFQKWTLKNFQYTTQTDIWKEHLNKQWDQLVKSDHHNCIINIQSSEMQVITFLPWCVVKIIV